MGSASKKNGKRISLHPLSLDVALAAALKAGLPPDKPRRGDNDDKKRVEKATEVAIDIYEEALNVVIKGLSSDVLNHRGNHYDFYDVPMELRPLQKPYPPMWAGAGSPESQERCARYGMNMMSLGPPKVVRQMVDFYSEAWERTAEDRKQFAPPVKNPILGCTRVMFIADSDDEAAAIAEPAFEVFRASLIKLWVKWRGLPGFLPTNFEGALESGVLMVGSPSTIREQLEQQIEEMGVDYMVFEMAFGTLNQEQKMHSLGLFANEIMPHFATT